MMKIKFFVVLFFLLFALNHGARYKDRIKKTFPMNQDGKLTISNVNGSITLGTHSKNEISINAIKTADRKSDLENIILKFEFEKNELQVTTKRIKSKSTANVEISVKVPENLKFLHLKIANGPIEIDGRLRLIKAQSVNGRIWFRGISSDTQFSTINGGVFLIFQERLQGNISAKTLNGTVQIELPEDSSFTVKGSTLNGGIKSDFDVTVVSQFIGSKITGTINQGHHKIELHTTNGNIKILKI
jgi:DUF4097 and DUF4098 domain-containing protein YvlB